MSYLVSMLLGLGLIFGKPARPIQQAQRSTVMVVNYFYDSDGNRQSSMCTGVVLSASQGKVLTAKHCVTADGELAIDDVHGEVVKSNDMFAVVATQPIAKPPIKLADRQDVGEQVWTLGYGYGKMLVLARHIAAIVREVPGQSDLVLDGPLVPGMSGGPVVDPDGRLVGINQGTSEVVGVACSAEEVRAFLASK